MCSALVWLGYCCAPMCDLCAQHGLHCYALQRPPPPTILRCLSPIFLYIPNQTINAPSYTQQSGASYKQHPISILASDKYDCRTSRINPLIFQTSTMSDDEPVEDLWDYEAPKVFSPVKPPEETVKRGCKRKTNPLPPPVVCVLVLVCSSI